MPSSAVAEIEARRARLHTGPRDAVQYRYDVRDIADADALSVYYRFALDQVVSRLAVEFLDDTAGPAKQQVVFLLEMNPGLGRFRAVRLRMDPPSGEQTTRRARGTCRITLHMAFGLTPETNAAFVFPLCHNDFTLSDVIAILRGTYRHAAHLRSRALLNLDSDLTTFNFLRINDHGWDGCRDWIAQAFARFFYTGWVRWRVGDSLGPPPEDPENGGEDDNDDDLVRTARLLVPCEGAAPIDWDNAFFDQVVGLRVEKPVRVDSAPDWATTYYVDVALATGEFPDRNHRHHGAVLVGDGLQACLPYLWNRLREA